MAVIPRKPGSPLSSPGMLVCLKTLLFAEVTPEADVQISALSKAAGLPVNIQEPGRQDTPAVTPTDYLEERAS